MVHLNAMAFKMFCAILQTVPILLLAGCSSLETLGGGKLTVPPEFDQKIVLEVDDSYETFQATRSGHDIGDLQSFHSQHTFPVVVEDAFKEMFSSVEVKEPQAQIEAGRPDVPAVFEVRMVDLANDIYNEADSYRAEVTIAVAMKSPRDHIFWQQIFKGEGYVNVDPQFSTGLGPQDAVLDGVRDAISQMQQAIVSSPEIRLQMKYYQDIDKARSAKESGLS